jgi:hypothetical protein
MAEIKEFKAKSSQSTRKPNTTIITVDFQKKEVVAIEKINNIKLLMLELKAQEQQLSEKETELFLNGSIKRLVEKIK